MLGDHLQGRRGVHRRRADLAVAHDDRQRVVALAERDDVVLGGRLAGVDDSKSSQQGQRLRREVGAGDEDDAALLTASLLP